MFIALDGIDGSGKTSQLRLLNDKLEKKGLTVKLFDMGNEGFFDDIFLSLKSGEMSCDAEIRELLYYFEGVLFGERVVKPLLGNRDIVVIVDRYTLSFMSYGPLNGIPVHKIEELTSSMPWPDAYFFIDTPPEVSISRIAKYRKIDHPEIGYKNTLASDEETNRRYFLNHQHKVYANFSAAIDRAEETGRKVIRIDGRLSPDMITDIVLDEIERRFYSRECEARA